MFRIFRARLKTLDKALTEIGRVKIIERYLAPDFISRTATEIDMPNIVTGVLASYRGYDTMGETAVIFTAGVGVMLALGGRRGDPLDDEDAA